MNILLLFVKSFFCLVLLAKFSSILHGAKALSLLSFSRFLRTIAPFFKRVFSARDNSEFYRGHQTDGYN